jgi:O-antigen/teichoic acid export membrane protein
MPRMTLGRQIAWNAAFNLAGRFVSVAGWMIVTPWMLARMGSERFGLWSLLTVIAGTYAAFDLGLAGSLTKFVAEFRAKGDRAGLRAIYTQGVWFYAALGALFLAIIVLARGPLLGLFRVPVALRHEAGTALLAAAVAYALLNGFTFLSSVLAGLHRLDLWNRILIVTTLIQFAGVIIVLRSGGGVPALFLNTGVGLLVGIVASRMAIRRLAPEVGFDIAPGPPGLLRRMMRYSAAIQIVNLGVLAQFQLDKVLFGSMLSLAAVGNYELGFRVVSALWSVPALLLPPLLPAVAHLDAVGERERVARLYRRASRYVLAVAFPIAAGVIALSPPLFQAWLGPGHGDAAIAAIALAGMLAVNILTGVGSAIVRGAGRPGLEARYQLLAMVLHLSLSLTLIPRWGFRGGMVASAMSTAIASLWFVRAFHRHLGEPLPPFVQQIVLPPLAGAVLAGVAAWWAAGAGSPDLEAWARPQALARLALGAGAFLVVVTAGHFATRALRPRDVRELFAVLRGPASARGKTA